MIRSLSRYLFFTLALLLLAACDNNIQCIEPDDWGQQVKYSISGKNNGNFTVNPDHSEVGGWNKGGFILNGYNVIGVVKNSTALESNLKCDSMTADCTSAHGGYCPYNTWTAWYGDWGAAKDQGLCKFKKGWCPTGVTMEEDVPVSTVPCLFSRGLGLYLAITDDYQASVNSQNPFKENEVCNQINDNCYLHVGDGSDSPRFFDNYCPAHGFIMQPPDSCKDGTHRCGMVFKMSDRYYADNKGQYTVVFKQGITDNSKGPLSKFAQLVTGILCDATTKIYNTIIHESSFRSYVGVLLILFIASMGISFLIGTSNMTHTELITMALKFGLVSQLIMSDTSWSFFNDYFFSFFINGIGEITGILFGEGALATNIGATPAGQCAPNVAGIEAFDRAIARLFSYETTRKIMSLMVWRIYGIVFILAIYVMIVIIILAIVKALLIFLVSFLAISILIILAPLFIPFMLFKLTREFFENWLKQLVSHFIQPIIILTFAFFMVTMLMNQLEFLFGYRVCWKEWFEIPVIKLKFYAWQSDYNNNSKGCLPTPNSIYVEDEGTYVIDTAPGSRSCGGGNQDISGNCTPYACYQERYIGFPYLDPQDTIDKDRIHELQSNDLMSFSDLVIMLIMVWFMVKFNKIVPGIAKRLGGTLRSQTNVGAAGAGITKGLGKAIRTAGYHAANPIYKRATGRDMKDDAKALRKKLLFEVDTEREKEMKELKEEHSKLISGLRGTAGDKSRSLEDKARDVKRIKSIKSRMKVLKEEIKHDKTAKSFYARSLKRGSDRVKTAEGLLNAPKNIPLSALKKVGQKTIGVPLRKVIKGDEEELVFTPKKNQKSYKDTKDDKGRKEDKDSKDNKDDE